MNNEPVVWAFDLGKGSIGEAVRQGTTFLHKASLRHPAPTSPKPKTPHAVGGCAAPAWRTTNANGGWNKCGPLVVCRFFTAGIGTNKREHGKLGRKQIIVSNESLLDREMTSVTRPVCFASNCFAVTMT